MAWPASAERDGRRLVICGDLNIALTDLDVHPKERKPNIIGQRPDERALLDRIIGRRPRGRRAHVESSG